MLEVKSGCLLDDDCIEGTWVSYIHFFPVLNDTFTQVLGSRMLLLEVKLSDNDLKLEGSRCFVEIVRRYLETNCLVCILCSGEVA